MGSALLEASLVADQCPKDGMLAQILSRTSASAGTPSPDLNASRGIGPHFQWGCPSLAAQSGGIDREVMTIDAHLLEGRRVLGELKRSKLRAAEMRRFQDSMRWLNQNRSRYGGQWIALDGDKLLAAYNSAEQVFSEVGDLDPVPLVVHVEEDETPFAGW